MKKTISLIMGMLLFVSVLSIPVFGSEEDRVMMIVSCPEQNFATVCEPEYTYDYTPDGGLAIQLDDESGNGVVTIFKTDAPGADFAAETYFENAFIDSLVQSYGNSLLDIGEYTIYPFAGKELPGRMALYDKDGETQMRFCLFDLEDDYFVRYEAFSVFDETIAQNTVDVMSDAIRYFQPDAMYYYEDDADDQEIQGAETEPEPEINMDEEANAAEDTGVKVYQIYNNVEEAEAGPSLQIVSCTAEGFSTKCGIRDRVEYKDSLGVTAFLDVEDATVWVRVHRLNYDPDFDVETYFQEEVTPSMEYIYKDNSYGTGEFTSYQMSYKYVEGQEYQYSIGGNDYTRRVMIYKNDSDIVRFEMTYTEDTYDRVLWDLDKVMTCYEPDPDYYQSSYSAQDENKAQVPPRMNWILQ